MEFYNILYSYSRGNCSQEVGYRNGHSGATKATQSQDQIQCVLPLWLNERPHRDF